MILLLNITMIIGIFYSIALLIFLFGQYHRKKGDNKILYRVSVIIAARNEEKNIQHVLLDLTNQSYPKDLYEVIVADDNSTDNTAAVVSKFCETEKNVKLLSITTTPPGTSPKKIALSRAVDISNGEIILTTDADCRLGSHWIETMVTYFTENTGFVIGFSQLGSPIKRQNLLEKLQAFDFLQLMGACAGSCNLGLPLAATGQNLGYRRVAFERVGGYNSIISRISGDDVLLLQRIRRLTDYDIAFASHPRSYATSKAEPDLRSLLNQRRRWASNASYQVHQNIPFFSYLLLVFAYNLMILIDIPGVIFFPAFASTLVLCIVSKAASELMIAIAAFNYFKRSDLLKYFPLWFVLQIPYVVFVGLMGSFGKFTWKDRNHSAVSKDKNKTF